MTIKIFSEAPSIENLAHVTYGVELKMKNYLFMTPYLELVENTYLQKFCTGIKLASEIKQVKHLQKVPVLIKIEGRKEGLIL